jgi:hypothetical protein
MTEYNRYNKGKIYKLVSNQTDKIYIGSTCKDRLCQRLATHKGHYNHWLKNNNNGYMASYELFKLGDVEIILLESVNCNSKDELLKKEREYIEKHKEILVNKVRPIITKDERKQYRKQHTEDNKEKIKEWKKQYYSENKEEINERRKEIYNCECGKKYTIRNKARHERTPKHQKYINLSN